tara:strand:- start:69 stop:224 length:156 start_codon:yes stop_codon:yes gene_type:complete
MQQEEYSKAIATLADKVSKIHERLLATERDLKRHQQNSQEHCCDDCSCKKN